MLFSGRSEQFCHPFSPKTGMERRYDYFGIIYELSFCDNFISVLFEVDYYSINLSLWFDLQLEAFGRPKK